MSDFPLVRHASAPARLARQDGVCDRFEAAWKAGRKPRLEAYLIEVPSPEQWELLRELLALELLYRHENGEKPELDEYRQRFPPHGELIETAFSEARQVTPKGSQPANQPFEPSLP